MSDLEDNETWLIDTGHDVIEKQTNIGSAALSPRERLIFCLWIVDYSMRNAGDLDAAHELHAGFHEEARVLAEALSLPRARAAFSLNKTELRDHYFDLFDGVCIELRATK